MNKRKWILGLMLGGVLLASPAQNINRDQEHILRAKESQQLESPIGMIESLTPVYKDVWKIEAQDDEAIFLEVIARSMLQTGDAELKLLKFIEQNPHSSYIHHAMSALGQFYYVQEQYGSAAYWLRQVNTSLLPERTSAAVDYYHGYSLLREGRDKEALKLLEPLTYSQDFREDANFYAGYLLMKQGDLNRGVSHLNKVIRHPMYGSYANAYIAEGQLSEMQYSAALKSAEAGLQTRNLPPEVMTSLYRTAGLASSNLGQLQTSTNYLEQYMRSTRTPGRLEQLILGKNLFEMGRHSESEEYLLRSAEGRQDFMSQLALYYAGLAQLSLRQPTRAISSFDRSKAIAAHAPLTEAADFNAALAAYAQTPGKLSAGTQRLGHFLSVYPNSEYRTQVIGHLSDAFLNEPNASTALQEIDRINPLPRELATTRERVRLRQANRALESGQTASASKQYDDIIRSSADPVSVAEAHLWKGEAAYRTGDYRSAINSTESYLRTRPNELELNVNAYYTLGYAYYNLAQYGEAERNFRAYLDRKTAPTPDERTAIYNRLGDIELQRRAYDRATSLYNQAEQAGGAESDHALFNKGMILGLQNNYAAKANALSEIARKYPNSKLIPEAMYEQGSSLALAGDLAGARQVFDQFFLRFKRNEFAPKVGVQLALSYFNENRLDEASKVYEMVIRDYPSTPEAQSALQDLKSISVQLNRVQRFNQLVSEVGATGAIPRAEMDSLAFLAAERVVASGDVAKADEALNDYLRQYPNGAFVNNVHYNKALLQYNSGNYRGAVEMAAPIASRLSGKLAEDTYRLLASSYDRLNESGRAAEAYYSLAQLAGSTAERSNWVRASAERAGKSESHSFAQSLASQVLNGSLVVNDESKSTVYAIATESYARSGQKGNAVAYAQRVLKLPNYGKYAMAQVIISLDLYDKGEYKEVQRRMQSVTQQGSTDAYWLARAFILLADSYEKQGDSATAKLYLESVKGSYTNRTDGILQMINERLARL